jgi:archaellum component FlaC
LSKYVFNRTKTIGPIIPVKNATIISVLINIFYFINISEHKKILKGHADETEDLRERCAELEKLVNSHVEDMKNFRDEIYNIVEEYLVNQTPRLQNNVDEGQKKLISELINRIDDLDKKVEDLQSKIHLTNAKSEKVEKLRMDRLKSAP